MAQSLAQIHIHIVFSTKDRKPRLRDDGVRDQLDAYMATMLEEVKKYIQKQQEHHRRMSFQEEFRELCRRHGLELDERYAWD